MELVILIPIISYFVIIFIIGFLSSRKETKEGFLIGDRKLTTFQFVATIVASFTGGGALVAYAAYIFNFGISALWLVIGYALAYILFIPFAKKLHQLSDEEKFYTLPDYFYKKFGRGIQIYVSILVLMAYLIFLSGQFIGGSLILVTITKWSYTFSLLIAAVIVLFYLLVGGFKAVIKTDVFQYIILILLLVFGILLSKDISITPNQLNPFGIGPAFIIGVLFFGFLNVFCGAYLWQRVYAAKNIKVVKKGLIYSAVFVSIVGIGIALISLSAKTQFPNIIAEQVMAVSITNLLPTFLIGFGIVVLFAAVMSSADTLIFALAISISRDFLDKNKTLSRTVLTQLTRFSLIVITIIGVVLAYFFRDIVELYTALSSILFAIAPIFIGSFYWRLRKKAIYLSLTSGVITTIILIIFDKVKPEFMLLTVPVTTLFLYLGQNILK